MPLQPDQRDPQHDLARARRPAHPPLRRLQPLEKAAAAQRHVAQPGPEVAQRRRHPVARRPRPLGRATPAVAAPLARRQEAVPVLRHPRPHLRQLEILAQPLGRRHQIGRQERLAVGVLAPRQHRHRALGHVHPHPLGLALGPFEAAFLPFGVLRGKGRGRLGQPGMVGLGRQHPLQRRPPRLGDRIGRHPAAATAGDPLLQREHLRHLALDHGDARGGAVGHLLQDHGALHLGGDRQDRAGLHQPAQDAAGLAGEAVFVGKRAQACHHLGGVLVRGRCVARRRREGRRPAQPGQRLVDKRIVATILEPADLTQHRRRVTPRAAGKAAQRHTLFGVQQIQSDRGRHPPGKLPQPSDIGGHVLPPITTPHGLQVIHTWGKIGYRLVKIVADTDNCSQTLNCVETSARTARRFRNTRLS